MCEMLSGIYELDCDSYCNKEHARDSQYLTLIAEMKIILDYELNTLKVMHSRFYG